MKKFALIVAGGSGSRMNLTVPKQFVEINGLPILMHTILAFLKFDSEFEIVLVRPKNQTKTWEQLCKNHNFTPKMLLAEGGETRFESVKNGLDRIAEDGIVFIHDGVRPMVTAETLENCLLSAIKNGNALPVVKVTESLRFSENTNNKSVDRSKYFLVQTPQTFRVQQIKDAYNQQESTNFTDDASVLETLGEKIFLVEGNRRNIKITYPEDLELAGIYLSRQ